MYANQFCPPTLGQRDREIGIGHYFVLKFSLESPADTNSRPERDENKGVHNAEGLQHLSYPTHPIYRFK